MKAALALLALVAAGFAPVPPACAGSVGTPPPSAQKEGGIEGDDRGAIRALGGTTQNDFQEGTNKVDVPKLGGGDIGRGGPPAGTRR